MPSFGHKVIRSLIKKKQRKRGKDPTEFLDPGPVDKQTT